MLVAILLISIYTQFNHKVNTCYTVTVMKQWIEICYTHKTRYIEKSIPMNL